MMAHGQGVVRRDLEFVLTRAQHSRSKSRNNCQACVKICHWMRRCALGNKDSRCVCMHVATCHRLSSMSRAQDASTHSCPEGQTGHSAEAPMLRCAGALTLKNAQVVHGTTAVVFPVLLIIAVSPWSYSGVLAMLCHSGYLPQECS
eukprot:jgi/Ulvmu1/11151/UM071_0035.1